MEDAREDEDITQAPDDGADGMSGESGVEAGGAKAESEQAKIAENTPAVESAQAEVEAQAEETAPKKKGRRQKRQWKDLTRGQRIASVVFTTFNSLVLLILIAIIVFTSLPASKPLTGLELESEVHRLAAKGEFWPGFNPLKYPLAIYDGDKTYLFRHPSPPKDFKPLTGHKDAYVYEGQFDEVFDCKMIDIGDEPTAIVTLDGAIKCFRTYYGSTAIHELFHVYQEKCEEIWPTGKWKAVFIYPCYDIKLFKAVKLEERALAHALEAKTTKERSQWALIALSQTRDAFKMMPQECADYIRNKEMQEGLASYIETLYVKDRTHRQCEIVNELKRGYAPEEYYNRTYVTGQAFGMLLDQLKPDWKKAFNKRDYTWLEDMLAKELGEKPARPNLFTGDELNDADVEARIEMSKAINERVSRTLDFPNIEGRVLIVESSTNSFYLNSGAGSDIRQLLGGKFVSSRDIGLKSQDGVIAVPELYAVLDPLPIDQGRMRFRRITVRGIVDEWEITYSDGNLKLKAGLLHAEFKSASFTLKNGNLTVTLHDGKEAAKVK